MAVSVVDPTRSATSRRVSAIGISMEPAFPGFPIRSARFRKSCAIRTSTRWPRISSSFCVSDTTRRVSSRMRERANSGYRSSSSK
jgi:hypothetical protein